MKKSDIIKIIYNQTNFREKDIRLVVDYFLDAIMDSVADDKRIELRKFGVFNLKKKPSRMIVNPRNGVRTLVQEHYLPSFKMGKYIKKELNKNQKHAKKS